MWPDSEAWENPFSLDILGIFRSPHDLPTSESLRFFSIVTHTAAPKVWKGSWCQVQVLWKSLNHVTSFALCQHGLMQTYGLILGWSSTILAGPLQLRIFYDSNWLCLLLPYENNRAHYKYQNIIASLFYLRVKYSFSVETVSRNIVICTSTGNHHIVLVGIYSNLKDERVPEHCRYTSIPRYLSER